ncbi:hypothetical protein [Qipengyuania profunda]|uniref:hypothetical protein n=1 Tax=Qipengyuania profunda TaxID=3113984 RepID=UPI002A18E61B|nr:hypothetical protein [Qipengyuania sp. HL-TH1]WPL55704.1 hypothetical protein SD421_09450 [Qipengyuania sp. HL-TH5]
MKWTLLRRCVLTGLIAIILSLALKFMLMLTLGRPLTLNQDFWIETAPVMFLVGFFIPLAPRNLEKK